MSLEELRTKSTEEIIQIVEEFGDACYKAGENDACAFEYGHMERIDGRDSFLGFLLSK